MRVVPSLLFPLMLLACSDEPSGTTPEADAAAQPDSIAESDVDANDAAEIDAAADGSAEVAVRSLQVFDRVRISSSGAEGEFFHRAQAPVDFGSGPFANVTLRVKLETTCYPFEDWTTPPPGHNWPADCDAFDRNFEFTLDEPGPDGGPPAIELVRAITPFGGPMEFDIDITDIANFLPGEHTIDVLIPTYSDGAGIVSGSNGGWNVSAEVLVQDGPAPRNVLAVTPLFNGNFTSTSELTPVAFEVPEGVTEARIDYRTTGHGGGTGDRSCIGPAEEFCRRSHSIDLDGAPVWFFEPWIESCEYMCDLISVGRQQVCEQNPCGSIASVRAPRANWCPGDITPPELVTDDALTEPGAHTFAFFVSNVAEGGSWRTSAVYVAYGD